MTNQRIPTMPCLECDGSGIQHRSDGPRTCRYCFGRRRIPRQPLTPDQIAALPVGTPLVYQYADGDDGGGVLAGRRGDTYLDWLVIHDECRVWLAEEEA